MNDLPRKRQARTSCEEDDCASTPTLALAKACRQISFDFVNLVCQSDMETVVSLGCRQLLAFLAAWAHMFQELPIRLKSSETIEHLIQRHSFEGSLYSRLLLAWSVVQEQLPEECCHSGVGNLLLRY